MGKLQLFSAMMVVLLFLVPFAVGAGPDGENTGNPGGVGYGGGGVSPGTGGVGGFASETEISNSLKDAISSLGGITTSSATGEEIAVAMRDAGIISNAGVVSASGSVGISGGKVAMSLIGLGITIATVGGSLLAQGLGIVAFEGIQLATGITSVQKDAIDKAVQKGKEVLGEIAEYAGSINQKSDPRAGQIAATGSGGYTVSNQGNYIEVRESGGKG